MKRPILTGKVKEVFDFIVAYYEETQQPITAAVIKAHFRHPSINSANQFLGQLCRKGYLEKNSFGGYELRFPGEVPIYGSISAGPPTTADTYLQGAERQSIGVENLLLWRAYENLFALDISGDSMVQDGIFDGDTVFLVKIEDPRSFANGIIAAVLFRGETTLKRIYRTPSGGIRLTPANPSFSTIEITSEEAEFDDVYLLGRYVGRMSNSEITFLRSSR